MNRQFRRAQEKQDKKQQREKERRREERRDRLRRMRNVRRSQAAERARDTGSKAEGEAPKGVARGRQPGRFSGVLAAITVFFITLQSVAPADPDAGLGASLVAAGFYLMLGYFATMWFMRTQPVRAPLLAVAGGILLAGSVTVAQYVQQIQPDLLALALTVPALVVGAFLGRVVFIATPR